MVDRAKAICQFKIQLNGVFEPFNGYGLVVFVPEAINQAVELALLLYQRLNGEDIPIVKK